MKNTRRAAAAWMTMSLAVSTVLGNTAWGDVLQETGKNSAFMCIRQSAMEMQMRQPPCPRPGNWNQRNVPMSAA